MIARKLIIFILALVFVGGEIPANGGPVIKTVGDVTGLKIPRFVSTKSSLTNVRTGPGRRYPIRVKLLETLPLKIVDEYKDWRKIEDFENQTGWVHKALLSSRRLGLVQVATAKLYRTDEPSGLKAYLGENVILKIEVCDRTWCYVNVPSHDIDGYVKQIDIWGIFPNEKID